MANNVCMHMQEKEQYKSMTNFPDNKKSDKIDSIEIDWQSFSCNVFHGYIYVNIHFYFAFFMVSSIEKNRISFTTNDLL